MSDAKLSEAQLQALRAWAQSGIDGSMEDQFWLRLLDEHRQRGERIAELERAKEGLLASLTIERAVAIAAQIRADGMETERGLLRAVVAHVADGTVYEPPDGTDSRVLNQDCWDAVRALEAHDARHGGGGDGQG